MYFNIFLGQHFWILNPELGSNMQHLLHYI